jgi:antitoxin MazE
MNPIHEFVVPQKSGVVRLSPEVRQRLGMDRPGAQLEITETDDGLLFRGVVPVPVDQEWFWTKRWQEMEREADADIAAGRYQEASDVDEFLSRLGS